MGGRFSPLIIIILIAIVVSIGFFAFNMLRQGGGQTPNPSPIEELPKPIVELNKQINEEENDKVIITVNVMMEDGSEVQEILLPNGTTVTGNTTTYEVTENGEYEFTAYGVNGQSETNRINISEIPEISATNPYIPEGFTKVGGYPESGFVIEDEYGNQYVWVPVESGKLTRNTMLNTDYAESSSAATSLVNSVAKYYGFYMGRFESSQYEINGEIVSATMSGKNPWTNINCQDAINYSNASANAFGYTDCKTSLVSSYAWDTALAWIDKSVTNYSSNTNYGNYSGTIYPTGYTSEDNINNICDLAGNVREWTTEIYKSAVGQNEERTIYRVVRGGSANLSRTPGAHIGYAEDTSDAYWGFRMVLYK